MKVWLAVLALLGAALTGAVMGGFLTVNQLYDHTYYLGQLIFGWSAWVCFVALVYAGIESPGRIQGNAWFAVAGVFLTGGAFAWWAWYFSKVPGAGGEMLPCLVYTVTRCDVAAKVPALAGVTAYNPMAMWAGIACIAAWVALMLAQGRNGESASETQRPASPGQ